MRRWPVTDSTPEKSHSDLKPLLEPQSIAVVCASQRPGSLGHKLCVENQETLCAGAIAGGAIIGILIILVETTAG